MVTIHGNLYSCTGPGTGYVEARLAGFGKDVPRLNSTGVIIQPQTTTLTGGSFSFQLFGNDKITPANTYYILSFFDPDGCLTQKAPYIFADGDNYDLASTVPANIAL